jgi:predicted nucleic acid-binding Zn ribbon protein
MQAERTEPTPTDADREAREAARRCWNNYDQLHAMSGRNWTLTECPRCGAPVEYHR